MFRTARSSRASRLIATAVWLSLLCGCGQDGTRQGSRLPTRPDLTGFPPAYAATLAAAEAAIKVDSGDPARWERLAHLYHANGHIQPAAASYRRALALGADRARIEYFLADLAGGMGDLAEQARGLRASIEAGSRYLPAHLALAEVLYKSGEPQAAAAEYGTALELDPHNVEARLGLARLDMQAGDTASAMRALEALIALDPKHSTGLSLLARLVEEEGDASRAAALRHRARLRKDPPRADPWMDEVMEHCFDVQRLGIRFEDFVKSAQQDAAWRCLRRLEAVDDGNWMVCRIRGMAAELRGQPDAAVREYERALLAGGDPATLYPQLLDALLTLQRWNEIEARAGEALRVLPGSPHVRVLMAEVKVQRGDRAGAQALLTEVLAREPGHERANFALSRLYWEAGDHRAAAECLERIRNAAPLDLRSRALLGQYHLEQDRPVEAVAPLAEARVLDPDNRDLGDLLALAHLRAGNRSAKAAQFEQALRSYDAALEVRPDMPEVFTNKVQVLLRLQRFAPAADTMERLTAVQPANPSMFLSLGDMQHAAGRSEAARASWREALRLLGASGDGRMRDALLSRLDPRSSP